MSLTLVSNTIKYYKRLIREGRVKPDGSAAKRCEELEIDYLFGRRRMEKDSRVKESLISNKATPVTKKAAAARPSIFKKL